MCAVRPLLGPDSDTHTNGVHDWPHSPIHRLSETGIFMVTSGTYQKTPFFHSADRLTLLANSLIELCQKYSLGLETWAVFPNHYHFVAQVPQAQNLKRFARHLHSTTAIAMNREDNLPARKIWFQYWESHITFQRSYLARPNYVHQNPVKHKVVRVASQYPWCSAGWFERKADPAFFKTVMNFPYDKLEIPDDFDV